MNDTADQRQPRARMAYVTAIALGLFLLGPGLAYGEVLPAMVGFGLFAMGALLGLVAGLIALIAILRKRARPGARFALLGFVPFIVALASTLPGAGNPAINDITTDVDNPPLFTHAATLPANQGRDMTRLPQGNAELITNVYADVQPLELPLAPNEALARVVDTAKRQPRWEVTQVDEDRFHVECIATTSLFKFRDDLVIRITPTDDGCRIDMRSKSRDGQGDLGANANRIKAFLLALGSES